MGIWLWKNGADESFQTVNVDLETLEPSIFDRLEYDYLTVYYCWGLDIVRCQGLYRFGTAEASVLIRNTGGRHDQYFAKIKSTDIRDVQKLISLILTGKIWPVERYKDDQILSPARHIGGLLKEMWEIIRREVVAKLRQIPRFT